MTHRVKDWKKFQHFKDRRPPWIKLYRDLLDDIAWHELEPEAAKLLVMLWLIASEYDGALPSMKTLAFRLRMSEEKCKSLISKLSHWLIHDDIAAITDGYQDSRLERETEEEKETEEDHPRVGGKRKPKAAEQPLADWLVSLDGADAVPADDPLFAWAAKQGIPHDWLGYAWAAFEDRYAGKDKTYADWRAAFRDHVKRGWLDIWRLDGRSGGFVLTTAGEQWRREVSA